MGAFEYTLEFPPGRYPSITDLLSDSPVHIIMENGPTAIQLDPDTNEQTNIYIQDPNFIEGGYFTDPRTNQNICFELYQDRLVVRGLLKDMRPRTFRKLFRWLDSLKLTP